MSVHGSYESHRPPPSIPDYELLRVIGRGAYGEVWLARNVTGSFVALKVVSRSAFDHDRPFEREFEGIKRFEPISRSDSSQVAILHVGRGDGYFYYVMELADAVKVQSPKSDVQGHSNRPLQTSDVRLETLDASAYAPLTLKRLLNDRGALPAEECLAIALSLTRALAHLHGHGLVHRDVKPSNVIFVNGQAKLADIGLVTSVDATRSFVGTEGYLPAEGAGTPQADLYSLGKVLYEMSTGCDRKQFPALPADIATRPDRNALAELNAIVVRACQIDPRERYASANAMRGDLDLLHSGRSVRQRQARSQATRMIKRVGLAVGALAILAALAFWVARREARPPPVEWSTNEEANDAYRNGIWIFHQGESNSFVESAKFFELAVQKDPTFARAHARLARSYFRQNPGDPQMLAKARRFAYKALELKPDSDEANTAVAVIKTLLEFDWRGAEKHHLKAIRLNPDGQDAEENLYSYATFLSIMGRTNEAIKQVDKALALPSRSLVWLQSAGFVYLCARQYDRAIKIFEEIIQRQPSGRNRVGNFLVQAYRNSGNYRAAIKFEEEDDPVRGAALQEAYDRKGEPGYWRRCLDLEKGSSDLVWLAILHVRVSEKEAALNDLEQAVEKTPTDVVLNINREPSFDSLRGNPKFENVRKKLGFR